MDKKTVELKKLGSKKPKFLKILVLFFIFNYAFSFLGFFGSWSLLDVVFVFLFVFAFLGLIRKKKWSTILISNIVILGIIVGIFTKDYISIPFYILLFWLDSFAYNKFEKDASGFQIKTKTAKGLKRRYPFLINTVQTFLIAVIILVLGYMFIARPFQVGTGMEPTIKKGSYVLNLLLPLRFISPGRQDIVSFIDPIDKDKDYISRVIGIPGDKIVLKDGYVYLNGKILDEPYTLKPRSTWVYSKAILGQNCQQIVVPKNNYFIMGDNREKSPFSIYIGFIPKNSIVGYVPHNLIRFLTYNPIDWSTHLRDTTHDKDLMGKSVLIDVNKYVELINQKRVENGIQPLKYDIKLEKSAGLRLQNMIKFDDFSHAATKSGYTMQKAISDVGYNTGIALELIGFTQHGEYYDSNSLFDFYWQSEDKKNLLDKNLQYIGVTSSVVDMNNCPRQVILQHWLGQQ